MFKKILIACIIIIIVGIVIYYFNNKINSKINYDKLRNICENLSNEECKKNESCGITITDSSGWGISPVARCMPIEPIPDEAKK